MSFGSRSLPPPTTEQKRRWELIDRLGLCVACWMGPSGSMCGPVEHHHIKSGNLRMGHDFTIGLCQWHHRGVVTAPAAKEMRATFGPSLMDGSALFHATYGSDEQLLSWQNQFIGWTAPPVRERARRNGSPTAKPKSRTDATMTSTGRRTFATKGHTKQSRCQPSTKTFPRTPRGYA